MIRPLTFVLLLVLALVLPVAEDAALPLPLVVDVAPLLFPLALCFVGAPVGLTSSVALAGLRLRW